MGFREYLVTRKRDIFNLDVKPRLIDYFLSRDFVLSIVGPRRAGKTYFIYYLIKSLNLKEEDFVFVNFEEEINDVKFSNIPFIHREIYGRFPNFIFLDEVQAMSDWVKGVYTLFEKKRFYIVITGSSSKLMAYEIATQLRGRASPIFVYPFSIAEVVLASGLDIRNIYDLYEVSEFKHILRVRMEEGFFPDVVLGNVPPHIFYRDYVDLVLYRDLVERFNIRNVFALETFVKSLITSNTKEFSINKIFKVLKSSGLRISKNTLYDYQKMLEDVRFFIFLRKYSRSARSVQLSRPKVYAIDTGIATYNSANQSVAKELEHVFFLELLKNGFQPNKNVFYWKGPEGYEVDFVLVEEGKVKELIQVTYAENLDEIKEREIRGLIKASKELGCKNLKIVTWDVSGELEIGGKRIVVEPIWKIFAVIVREKVSKFKNKHRSSGGF